MSIQLSTFKNVNKQTRRCASLLVVLLLTTFVFVPESEACVNFADFNTAVAGNVDLIGCGEGTSDTNVYQHIDVRVPIETVSGTFLIAAIAVDSIETVTAEGGWNKISETIGGNNDVTLAIFTRIAGANEPDTFTWTWAGTERAYGIITAWEEATGTITNSATNAGSENGAPTAPSINVNDVNNVILRIAGWDDDDQTNNLDPVIQNNPPNSTKYNITQDQSSGGAAASGAAGYQRYTVLGAADVATFNEGNNDEAWTAISLEIIQGAPGAETPGMTRTNLCPSAVDLNLGGPLVFYEQCTEFHGPNNGTSVPIDTPDQTAINDWMVAVINSDGARTVTAPVGWTEISDVGAGAIGQAVFIKQIQGGEPASHNFVISTADHRYGYIMRFSGASGTYVVTGTSDGNNANPTTPDLNPRVSDTMALYIATIDDDDLRVDEEPVAPADVLIDGITKDSARLSGGDISGIAGFKNNSDKNVNTGTEVLPIITGEQWRTITLGVEPIEFRYSMPDSESSVCGVQRVTLRATDGDGNALTWFTGTVSLSATNSTNAQWLDVVGDNVNAFSGTGSSTSYTFDVGDAGELVFDYYNPDVGSVVDFDVSFGAFGESDNDNYTPPASLNIIDCEFRIAYASNPLNSMGTCSSEAITISLVDLSGNAATNYSGTLTINNGSGGTHGTYTLNTGNAPDFSDAVADDGLATYAFNITPSNGASHQVVLDYTSFTVGVIDFDISEDSGLTITDDDGDATDDPNLTVGACQFVLIPTGDDLTDTCSLQEITLEVRDHNNALVLDYAGLVTISNDALGTGAGSYNVTTGTNSFTPAGAGTVTYQFDDLDDGDIVFTYNLESVDNTVNFVVSENVASGVANGIDTLDVSACTVDIQIAATTGVCAIGETMTVTIRDRDGAAAVDFDGEIEITANLNPGPGVGSGDYALTPGGAGGNGILTDTTPDDGIVRYDFDPGGGDAGVVEIDFSTSTVETLQFIAASTGSVALTMDGGSANDLDVQNCEVRISVADTTSDVCSIILVTFEVYSGASVFTNFDGLLNLDVNGGLLPTGDWFVGSEPGTLDNTVGGTGNGQASYQFNGTEGGNITLEYRTLTVQGVGNELNFDVSGTDLTESVGFDPDVDVASCNLTLVTASATNQGEVCRAGETVTYTITDRDGGQAFDFNGLLVLQTDGAPAIGDYALAAGAPSAGTGGFGTFDNLASNDGIATYQFDPDAGDEGILQVVYSVSAANTVTLDASSAGVVVDNTDGTLTFNDCQFLITFTDATPGSTDVCSTETVEIRIVESNGTTVVDDYTGTILLSTNTGDGTWAVSNAEGIVFDPTPEDGAASYTFVDDGPGGSADDDGIIELTFTHTASNAAAVNIDITDNTTTDPGNPGGAGDPNLFVDLCTFQISYDGGATNNNAIKTACEIQPVTIGIYRSVGEGGGLVTDYTGTVDISTSTGNGNWSIGTATGILNDTPGDDDGIAEYTFNGVGDGGEITLDFTNLNTETMTVNLIDDIGGFAGVIIEEGSADPELQINSCIPSIGAQSCAAGGSPLVIPAIAIDAQNSDPTLQGRMLVVATMHEINGVSGTTDVTDVQLDRDAGAGTDFASFAELIESRAFNGNELIGNLFSMREATGLPTAAGSYEITVTHTDDDTLAACAFYLTDVEQVTIAQVPAPNEDTGPLNATVTLDNPGAGISTSTTITTSQNNALVLSVAGQGTNGGDWDDVSPEPPITRLFNGPDPGGSTFGGSSGNAASAAAITVSEVETGNTFRTVHIVAAFNPLISGPPVAVGYEPVTLFQTYSGDISYITVGASLRTQDNDADSCVANNFASTSLILPELDESDNGIGGIVEGYVDPVPGDQIDSTVLAAYLYWFGSGDVNNPPVGVNFDQVTFVDPSLTSTGITADELFSVENVGGGNNLNYFAGYKDVTSLVTGNGTYEVQNHPAQFTTPWSTTSACGGGWALVVVYENPFEQLRVINLFHGFQPFQNSAFTLVPRNFRMASPDTNGEVPNGQVTHVTLEGDYDIDNGDESLTIQDAPGSNDPNNFIPLVTDYNPLNSEFNSTITRPVFVIQDIDPTAAFNYKYQWDSTANGVNQSNGYEIDFPGDQSPDVRELGGSWGVDADTHYISGDEAVPDVDDNVLFPFSSTNAEEITTRYSSGQDLVLLVSEVISVTNAPIADVEITLSEVDLEYGVNSVGNYSIDVTNNGNGASSYGSATGNLTVTGEMPAGYTFAAAGDVSGTGWTCSVTLDPGAFTCDYDILSNHVSGLNQATPSANALNFTVQIGGPQDVPIVFPSLNNDAKVIVRLQHNNGACVAEPPGTMPDPLGCESPEFDNVNDLQGGVIDIDDLDDKTGNNNNVDSVTTNVRGIRNNLRIVKTLNDTLEPMGSATFTLAVTNLGPDDIVPAPTMTTPTITLSDTEPSFIEFDSLTPDAGWSCSAITNPGSTDFTCDFSGTLLSGQTTNVVLGVDVTGTEGQLVSNTASVATGLYNFDEVPGNNSDSDGDTIQAPPAAATERFLLSVSSALGVTTLGSGGGQLVDFEDDDLIIFDPILDEATMFLDNSAEGFGLNDINAVHLLPNGQVILSTASASTVGDNNFAFDANDLVIYDPITRQGSLFFDGDTETETTGVDIDAVYVLDNGDIVFSTAADVVAGIGWSDSDLVLYDGSSFSIYLDAEDPDVFDTSTVNVDATYVRVDPADATMVIDNFIFSSADEGVTVTDDNGVFGRDDVIEAIIDDNTNPDVTSSDNLFAGNVPIGVFSAFDAARTISALHVLEDGYLGKFAISESQAGSACEAGQITITKRQGLTASVDTDYTGTIIITTDTMPAKGVWSIALGNGTLDNSYGGDTNNGQALYTFVASDNGQVTLNLDVTEDPPVADAINIDVTNGVVVEDGGADPTFNFNLVVSAVTHQDDFAIASFANNTGTTNWSNDWQEVDDDGMGPSSGNVSITGGRFDFTSTPATTNNPQASRVADLSLFTVTETVFLNFDYTYSDLNASDEIRVLARPNDGVAFTEVANYTGLSGTNASPTAVSLDLTTLLGSPVWTDTTEISFEIVNGYTLASIFSVDNVSLETGTTDCGIGTLHHYDIILPPSNGLACVTSQVTIVGHDVNHLPVDVPDLTAITLSTSTGAGTWISDSIGGVVVDTGTLTDGQGTYTYPVSPGNTTSLAFNYTNPGFDGATVSFNITSAITELQQPDHDPELTFDEVGLLFYNETTDDTDMPFQIAGKPSIELPVSGLVTLQLVRSVPIPGENPAAACESLLDDGEVATMKLAAMCDDPATCAINQMTFVDNLGTPITNVPVFNAGTVNPETSGVDVDLLFEDQATVIDGEANIGSSLNFTYSDVGQISLHAEFDIPVGDDINGLVSGDTVSGASEIFTVRPFAFDIDFGDDRRNNTDDSIALDANGTPFARAGVPFSATVKAVAWQEADDDDVTNGDDGNPDPDADLSDNPVTPSFGNETTVPDHTVILSIDGTNPGVPDIGNGGGAFGNIVTGEAFDGFSNGISTHNITIDEVGIFDMNAVLVDNPGSQTPINYLGLLDSEGVLGRLVNFGRVYPNNFEATINTASFSPRANQSSMCVATSPFTYLGEQFELNIDIQAKNGLGNDTVNYVDDFAKLTTFNELDIRAIIDETGGVADIDLGTGTKLLNDSIPANFSGSWNNGRLQLQGNMNLARQMSGVEEAPFTNVQIAFGPIDDNDDGSGDGNDVVLDVLNVDLDDGITEPGANLFRLIETHEFRYGRLIIDNAFGPETEDLEIPIRVEYYDGTEFITNTDDNCTSFFYDSSASPPALDYVGTSFEGFTAVDTLIENDVDATVNVFGGLTGRAEDGDTDETNDSDRPFFTTAPDPEGDDELEGRVLIEFDLSNPSLPSPLDFLGYDWRGDPGEIDDYDEIPDGDYSDNPRGLIEFGTYRGHDRVINWQEIYINN